MSKSIEQLGFSKINIGLAITGKRDDGYHNIDSIFQSIRLADSIYFAKHHSVVFSGIAPELPQYIQDLIPYDERNLAVRRAIRHLIEVAHKDGKTVSICGQAPSVYPELCEFLVKSGIDSISVNPDAVKNTKKMVAQIEQRMMLDALTGRGRQEVEDLEW